MFRKITVKNSYLEQYPKKRIILNELSEKILKKKNITVFIIPENHKDEIVFMDKNAAEYEEISQKDYDKYK